MAAQLAIDGLCKSFGALRVLDGISFSLAEGETLGILGPNGAGKTTLFNLISGDLRADAGTIVLGGQDITRQAPHRRCRLGIGRSYQIPKPWGAMTVFENLVAAASFGARQAEAATYARAVEILRDTGLLPQANRPAAVLRLLDRKRLELARALATQPRLLLLDEIAAGLSEAEAALLIDELRRIKAQGVSMIWIEHVVHALLAVADRLLVISQGRPLAEGAPHAVINDPEVKRVYLGIEA
ncbi:MAG TPA: ABC transporter ATP-binding protein [Polyangia bacterium]|jgi:branched-chain amino acid transport system ATP-binding protein|nr:ABC transporter ATP-binding protein [Polyangia bacterium]